MLTSGELWLGSWGGPAVAISGRGTPATGAAWGAWLAVTAAAKNVDGSGGSETVDGVAGVVGVVEGWTADPDGVG